MILPPYAHMLGLSAEADADGYPVLLMPFADHLVGRPDFLHGGAIGGLLEMAAVAALMHALGDEAAATAVKPVNVTVDYMRGGRGKDTHARGRVTRLGTRVANVETIAWQDDQARPIAAARTNYLLVRDGGGAAGDGVSSAG